EDTSATSDEEPAETRTDTATDASPDSETDATASDETESAETTSDGRVFAAPSARRLAREEGIDIGSVDGSGPGGRVGERDVRAAAESETGGTDAEAEDEPESAVTQVESEGGQRATGSETATESASRERTLAVTATRT